MSVCARGRLCAEFIEGTLLSFISPNQLTLGESRNRVKYVFKSEERLFMYKCKFCFPRNIKANCCSKYSYFKDHVIKLFYLFSYL